MKSLITFKISESRRLQIVMDNQNKVNIYGYNTKELHVFDEIEARYIHNDTIILLAKDTLQHIITSFYVALEKTVKTNTQLESFYIGKVGYIFSKKTYMSTNETEKENDIIFSEYWVWSSPTNIQTWLYNIDNKIYLEISETYPWLFSDLGEDEHYITFDEYANNYKPILLIEAKKSLVQEWINQCHDILQKAKTT